MQNIKISEKIVLVALDVKNSNNLKQLKIFLMNDLNAFSRLENVFEFNLSKCGWQWEELLDEIEDFLNEEDRVILWSLKEGDHSKTLNFYRTTIKK